MVMPRNHDKPQGCQGRSIYTGPLRPSVHLAEAISDFSQCKMTPHIPIITA